MKKKFLTLFLLLISCVCFFTLGACDGSTAETPPADPPAAELPEETPGDNEGDTGNEGENPGETPSSPVEITGVSFTDKTVTYNGSVQSIVVTGVPNGVTVNYTNNTGTNAGTYNATAVLSGEGYITKTLTANLVINKASYDMSGVSWNYSSPFTYDGNAKTVTVNESALPSGVTVKQYSDNSKTNAGNYTASVTFTYDTANYNQPSLADLTWKVNKASYDMSGVSWNYSSPFTYDGNAKTVTVNESALPSGVTVKQYSDNSKTNAGNYTASVTFTYDTVNYNQPSLADLSWSIIEVVTPPETLPAMTFEDESFDYDGTYKTIEVQGTFPQGTVITYSCAENNAITNTAKDSGKYTITATISCEGYQTKTLTATLTIEGVEDERHIISYNSKLYFANALHNDYLYCYDGSSVSFVSVDIPYSFNVANGNLYFRSKSLFGGAIKTISASGTESKADVKGEYLTTDGTYLYYAVNGNKENSGIYKIDLTVDNPVPTLLSQGKAKHLTYCDGYLYFADGANGYKLTKISKNGGERTLVRDEKINTLTAGNGYLFYTVNNLIGDYIENYNISNGTYTKLTIDAGSNLTLIGNKLYYVNVDLATSYVYGDGIYYVDAFPSSNKNGVGTKLFNEAGKYSSLTAISDSKIAFYRVDDQMLCVYDVTNQSMVEVLDGFVAPTVPVLSTGSKTASYNGMLYYLDLHNDKCLYSYNPATGAKIKISPNKVSDFAIIGDDLYFNMVSLGVNNDLYKVSLKTGGSPVKVSAYDCVDIVFDGQKIFYVEQNAAGVRTAIHEINANGVDTIIYDKGVNNMKYYNGYIYFVDGDDLYRMPTTGYTLNTPILLREGDVDVFDIYDGVIYFREVLTINKNLSKINVDGTGYQVVISKTYDPVQIIVKDGYIYFYSDTLKSSTAGLFKLAVGGTEAVSISPKTVSGTTYYFADFTVIGNDLYFVNYALGGVGGDSHLYKINLTSSAISKVS